jgi:hypothetical protein
MLRSGMSWTAIQGRPAAAARQSPSGPRRGAGKPAEGYCRRYGRQGPSDHGIRPAASLCLGAGRDNIDPAARYSCPPARRAVCPLSDSFRHGAFFAVTIAGVDSEGRRHCAYAETVIARLIPVAAYTNAFTHGIARAAGGTRIGITEADLRVHEIANRPSGGLG